MSSDEEVGDIRDEYDFKNGVRGKYAGRFSQGTVLVVLDRDVADEFGTSDAVNNALRELLARRRAG